LKILSRITAPTEGVVKIKGRVASLLEVGTGFHGELTGRENIYLNGAILGMKKREIDRKIDEIIDFSEIEQHIDTPVKRYSSGMYVRLAFAVAAHLDSEILIADEVLAVGDAAFQKKALGKMNELSKGEGRTVLFVSHNMVAIRSICNKGIILDKGRILSAGDLDKCIALYIDTNTLLSGWVGDVGDENLRLKKVEFSGGASDKSIVSVVRGEPVELNIEYEILIPNWNYGFTVEVINARGNVIGESTISDSLGKEQYALLKTEGRHLIRLRIDTSILGRGIYGIRLDFAICNVKRIINEDPTIHFQIVDEKQNIPGVPQRHDFFLPPWRWEVLN